MGENNHSNDSYKLLTLSELSQQEPEVYGKLLIKCEWQTEYDFAFLHKEGEELPGIIKDLLEMAGKWPDKYGKLLVSIKLQLSKKGPLCNETRVRPWKSSKEGKTEIYEFKSSAGLGLRLFFFFHEEKVIVCTHAWVKDNEKKKKEQSRQFEHAAMLRALFVENDANDN